MKSKLGQNFLIDKNIAKFEVESANISKKDTVLEIGPGKGILTDLLVKKAKKVIAVELDRNLYVELQKKDYDNLILFNKDILKMDFENIPKFNKVVSNLPYQISSPITFKLLDYDFEKAILIYQKEFAERLVANSRSKSYSRISVNIYYKARCKFLKTVSKTCFKPKPKVDSAIVSLIPRKEPAFKLLNEDFFYKLTKELFNQRRKKIGSIIKQKYKIDIDNLPYADLRVEELEPELIGILSNKLIKTIK
jgi:16S rRNA (adenine1518-N6/adenine1519-N6)-dimethyltransferase